MIFKLRLSWFLALAILSAAPVWAEDALTEEERARRVYDHLTIQDMASAVAEANEAVAQYPESGPLLEAQVTAMAANGQENGALEAWERYVELFPDKQVPGKDPNTLLLEKLSWGVLNKGARSPAPSMQFLSIVGAVMTSDANAIDIVKAGMTGSHSILRGLSVQVSSYLRDSELQDELLRLLKEEPVWAVRMLAIRASGEMRFQKAYPFLEDILSRDGTMLEEKIAAVEAVVNILDNIDRTNIERLAKSDRSGLRWLACGLVTQFDRVEDVDLIVPLISDPQSIVRVSALHALGALRVKEVDGYSAEELIAPRLKDSDSSVAITAAWAMTLINPFAGQEALKEWLASPESTIRRFAAAALAATGKYGVSLAAKVLEEHEDPYVKANVALGLVGQRVQTDKACGVLFTFVTTHKEPLMWSSEGGEGFRVLAPSDITHNDMMPQYPEVVNQMTRLEVFNLLAIVQYPKALEAIRDFLREKMWGVTGIAAQTLLQEGDETALSLVRVLLKEEDRKLRVQAALALAMWGRDPEAIQTLQDAYSSADRDLKLKLLEALGHIGDRKSIPFLVGVLHEPFQGLRIVAATAIIQCINH